MNLLTQLRSRGHTVTLINGVAVVTWRSEPRDRERAERVVSERNSELVRLIELEAVVMDVWAEAKWK